MMSQCAPPGSPPVWATALLVGAVALALAALALPLLWLGRWRSRRFGALSLLGALLAVALAAWSLTLRGQLLAVFDMLSASYQDDARYCVTEVGHGGPGFVLAQYHAWLLKTTAMVDSLQREALITIGANVAFLLVAGAIALRAWRRDASTRADAVAKPDGVADDGSLSITALDARAPQVWPVWSRRWRALAALMTLALIATTLGGLAVFLAWQTGRPTTQTPMCSSTITANSLRELQGIGLELYATNDVVPVDAQAAVTTSKQQVSPNVVANASCVIAQLRRVQTSSLPELSLDQEIWVVAYHLSGSRGPIAAATVPSDHWLFIDAHNGVYVGSAILLAGAGG